MLRPQPVWSALSGNPLRFVPPSWPWRSLAYLFTSVFVGLLALIAFLITIAVGTVTIPLVIGLFILGGAPALGSRIAVVERRRLGLMGEQVPSLLPEAEPQRWWRRPTDPGSWRALGYSVL